MDSIDESAKPNTTDALRTQLTELNSRSRWYTSQLWQVPFAYLAITGVGLAGLANKSHTIFAIALIAAAVFGGCALMHLVGMLDGVRRAVKNLKKVEKKLELDPTVKYRSFYEWPLLLVLILAIALYFSGGIYLLLCKLSVFNKKGGSLMMAGDTLYRFCETIPLVLGAVGTIMLAYGLKEEIDAERKFLEELGSLPEGTEAEKKIVRSKWFYPGLILFISAVIFKGFLIWST
jgi:hypothetical protein